MVMDEQRKQAILFAATLLSARKLIEMMDDPKPNFRLRVETAEKTFGGWVSDLFRCA